METLPGYNRWPETMKNPTMQLLALLPFCVALIPISVVGLCQWRAVREAEVHAELKRDLIDRGLSVEEVERLTGGRGRATEVIDQVSYYRAEIARLEASLKKDLALRGSSARDIEDILVAWRPKPVSGRPSHDTWQQAVREAEFIREMLRRGRATNEIAGILLAGTAPLPAPEEAEVNAALEILRRSELSPRQVALSLETVELLPRPKIEAP